MIDKEKVIEVLKGIYDPELNVDIWTLGLIYDIETSDDKVKIKMTFTSIMCPFGPMLVDLVKNGVGKLEGVKEVTVDVVFEPPWKPSDELRAMLGV